MNFLAYKITNTITGSSYIGITKRSVEKRFRDHISASKRMEDSVLYRAMRKHGVNNFTVFVLAQSKDYESLKLLEVQLISQERTRTEFGGYNLTDGGDGNVGWIPTQETREKIRERAIERMSIPENRERARISSINYHTPETRKIAGDRLRGKPLTEEHKLNLSIAGRGRIVSEETREKLRKLFIGKPRPKHVVEILIKANTGKKASYETKQKMSKARSGKPKSEAHRAAMSKSHKARIARMNQQ